jgi:hypothetical protein
MSPPINEIRQTREGDFTPSALESALKIFAKGKAGAP